VSIPINVNAQILDTLNQVQQATMGPQVVRTSGAGKAYQSAAQSAAIAVQDAADELRNMATLSTTATGVALAQMLACPSVGASTAPYETTIQTARAAMTGAITDFQSISLAATQMLQEFPSG
jgi:hypothetical protein